MNPYEKLPEKAFWKLSVSSKSMFDIEELWSPKFKLSSKDKISTYGSCFAQHIGFALKSRGFDWLVAEKAPERLSAENAKKYNYGIFSARTGNIYTTSLLKQWVEWSLGKVSVPEEVWEKDGRFFDPFRPAIEPDGFSSKEEVVKSRNEALRCFEKTILDSDVMVFTLGLTESWFNSSFLYEYPMCPGTVAGRYNPSVHKFESQSYEKAKKNLALSLVMMRKVNPELKFLLTVSPVPLTASNSGDSVIVATMHSKSILRAVAGQLAKDKDYVDYFPSYEIINSPCFKGVFFEPNLRGVNHVGVDFVMKHFFSGFGVGSECKKSSLVGKSSRRNMEAVCEEELLDAFGKEVL
ncbi:GSCFA domain-containing protein [Marinobacter bryozoorum]|uniref:GSCFA domain-containing protein n=1 Tax=Marinobacter bryozoorum TaxID=256324 RepID=UPI002006BBCD|nr:GSCFA domain-containing protein [Marinobacter bryozoorum]MCK7544318.1 GSCFA domain-containing protein [Marinobacter bryozoorum]